MICSLDCCASTKSFLENLKLRAAKPLAEGSRRADRAVIFCKYIFPVIYRLPVRHIAFSISKGREGGNLSFKARLFIQFLAIFCKRFRFPMLDQLFKARRTEKCLRRFQQLHRQIGMTVGKAGMTLFRQMPITAGTAAPFGPILEGDQTLSRRLGEILLRARLRFFKNCADITGSQIPAALQKI